MKLKQQKHLRPRMIMRIEFVLILILYRVNPGYSESTLIHSGNKNMMARVTSVNISCEQNGMNVKLVFDQPFDGIVFSKGHYKDPKCRYILEGSGVLEATFSVHADRCGSEWVEAPDRQSLENTLVIQSDGIVQETWDEARQLRCDWLAQTEKRLRFRPVLVASLDVREMTFEAEAVAYWMDVQVGEEPFNAPVEEAVTLGEPLSLVIYARARNKSFDLQVKECFASDSPIDETSDEDGEGNATVVQLTDNRGCPLRPKLLGNFFLTRETGVGVSVNSLRAFAVINTFKFPDTNQVYLACNVVICRDQCPPSCIQPLVDSRIQLGQTLAPDTSSSTSLRTRTGRKRSRNNGVVSKSNSRSSPVSSRSPTGVKRIPINDSVPETLATRVGLKRGPLLLQNVPNGSKSKRSIQQPFHPNSSSVRLNHNFLVSSTDGSKDFILDSKEETLLCLTLTPIIVGVTAMSIVHLLLWFVVFVLFTRTQHNRLLQIK